MPLNLDIGEVLEGIEGLHRVVPVEKWASTPIFETAADAATEIFTKQGAIVPIHFSAENVLAQEYPGSNELVFVFCQTINGKELFYPYKFTLPLQIIADLRVAGQWDPLEKPN